MKKLPETSLILVVALLLGFTLWKTHLAAEGTTQPINPLLGDASYVARFGTVPSATAAEDLRIQTHLAYVEQVLRARPVAHLPARLRQRRAHSLNLLRAYWQAGVFPRNYAYAGRRQPCFIDRAGRICAVGYLVAQTAGRPVAELVNQRHQYDEVLAMHDATLDEWVAGSGLSLRECAMIQPAYGGPTTIEPAYGISSAALSGANVAALLLNRPAALPAGRAGRLLPAVAVLTGTAQAALGVVNYPRQDGYSIYQNEPKESKKILSMTNIGLGTATLLLGAWNLLHQPAPAASPRTSWSVGPAPAAPGQSGGASLYLTRRL